MDWEEWQRDREKKGIGNPENKSGGNKPFDFNKILTDVLGRKGKGGSGKIPKHLILIGVLVLILLWFLSGLFTVQPSDVGLIKRFGAMNRVAQPGLNYHFPYPLETVTKINIAQARRFDIGTVDDESLMLTGDENIVDIKFVVQYRIEDPIAYAFQTYNPEKAIADSATSAMRGVVGSTEIDNVLTLGRKEIQEATKIAIQNMMTDYKTGLKVENVELQAVHAPSEVIDAFKDVTSAREDQTRFINQANGHANDILPKAEGQAAAMVAQASGYKAARVNLASGQSERFTKLLNEYRKAPEVTRQRLLLETLDKTLPGADKVFMGNNVSQNVLPHLGLKDGFAKRPTAASSSNATSGSSLEGSN